ncbi:hypothetical protein [Leptospira sanjuanensis]|uniref:hypothetical protein n=1 Tax=Leptospira sanjuanensis TaxID=2879643 RepID=UPI001EE83A2E|nr:hypothetical protein [Leptospira sanjuanensis]MCG6167187.1 hypothetical protein [Leptospira sanjuanensis]MCG6167199.1 hypothetical protein [Leptospira sanjuanensis]
MKESGTQKGFVLGEPVRNKETGQKMYVEKVWNPTVSCVYFDAEKDALVKVEMLPENLERIKGMLPYLPK